MSPAPSTTASTTPTTMNTQVSVCCAESVGTTFWTKVRLCKIQIEIIAKACDMFIVSCLPRHLIRFPGTLVIRLFTIYRAYNGLKNNVNKRHKNAKKKRRHGNSIIYSTTIQILRKYLVVNKDHDLWFKVQINLVIYTYATEKFRSIKNYIFQ